jgi:hydrogenase maturation protein HypF
LGGFHLACDAENDEVVKRLRSRKFREEKPLAVMVRDLGKAMLLSEVKEKESRLLMAPQRPIVLLKKKEQTLLSPAVAPGMTNLGIMLPYAPLHHLLLEKDFAALVMTSANKIDEPISIGNREAVARLAGIADYFLINNRDILVRCDDSVAVVAAGRPAFLRRSRGYAPKPIKLRKALPPVLALGAHLKAAVCVTKGDYAFLSPHIGDMETPQARDFFHENIALLQRITESQPAVVACDLHPSYYSTLAAQRMEGVEVERIQHHHAHIVSCLAENGIAGPVIGLAMDGTGYGTDGQVWGCEFLVADEESFTRHGQLRYYRLPGGERAIREPWRTAVSLLQQGYGEEWIKWAEKLDLVQDQSHYDVLAKMLQKGTNSPYTSSLGRLFDGIAAILGIRHTVSFEGQAAMELETMAAASTLERLFPYDILTKGNMLCLDFSAAIRAITKEILEGVRPEEISCVFHQTLVSSFVDMAGRIGKNTGLNRVALSGGCFQNRILLEGCISALQANNFEVFWHSLVPTNDGGISLGQAVCAGVRAAGRK